MASVINKATNKFTKGLVLDFSPENTGNEVLTHALNATLLTFNGNELSLQNDMGNGRVETAFLPEGYIPVGTCEHGGIIYIVSYNPLEDKSLIGCFPSPERNISSDELGMPTLIISNSDFVDNDGNIKNVSKYVLLKNDKLNPGDKFIVTADKSIYDNYLQDLYIKTGNTYKLKENPILKLNIVSIEDSGKIIYLNSDIKKYEVDYEKNQSTNTYKYHILGTDLSNPEMVQQDIDEYRNILSSGYSVFKSKTSGKLAILAELVMIDEYSVTHSIEPVEGTTGEFNINIHTEVSPLFNKLIINNNSKAIDSDPDSPITLQSNSNYNEIPKLKYYYLEESNFESETKDGVVHLYDNDGNITGVFKNLKLSDLYISTKNNFDIALTGNYDFPKPGTYHGKLDLYTEPIDKNLPNNVFTKFYANSNHLVKIFQLSDKLLLYCEEHNAKYYTTGNVFIENIIDFISKNNNNTQLFIVFPFDTIVPSNIFTPDPITNSIKGYDSIVGGRPISLHTISNEFIPGNDPSDLNTYLKYESLKLGHIKFPEEIKNSNYFGKYCYRIVPCMEYGKLNHLAIENSIDFSKLTDFDNSKFNIWKYRIDGNQLRLTFGTEIYDTFSLEKVIGLVLEFYDHRGFAGSIEIKNKKSYSGIFNKTITLNSQNEIDNKKIVNNEMVSGFVHNANIIKEDSLYKYNGNNVIYSESKGWYDARLLEDSDSSTNENGSQTPDNTRTTTSFNLPNDCGTLYSNILYGVKPYFKCENKEGNISYEKKDDLFLYTIPFYNDYYYNRDNFNELESPELNMILTYMLDDLSTRSDYNKESIKEGYYNFKKEGDETLTDYEKFEKYFSTDPMDSQFDIVKYYKYEGTTNLKLEVGLKQEYNNFLISCDPGINDKFSCTIELKSDNDPDFPLTVTSGEFEGLSPKEILNYKSEMELNLNNIWIGNKNLHILPNESIWNYNFLNRKRPGAIKLNYEFIVGYKLNVSDIVLTEVLTTVVCALCHKKPNGEYNYEDFGIFEIEGNYYSNNIIYTKGNHNKFIIGIALLKNNGCDNKSLNYKILYDNPYSSETLEKIATSLGKLVFCAPHYNYSDKDPYNSENNTNNYGCNLKAFQKKLIDPPATFLINEFTNPGWKFITPYYDWNWELDDYTNYIIGSKHLGHQATLNMCAVTQQFGLLYGNLYPMWYKRESANIYIVSGHDGSTNNTWEEINSSSYLGLPLQYLTTFNKYLINSMKTIYVYNPDYNSLIFNKGTVNIQNYNPSFISNIFVNEGNFDIDNLNNYISISGFKFSEYLSELTQYSEIETSDCEQLKLKPNTTYCGGEGYYLLTSLTYNVPVPGELKYEFEYNTENVTFVKTSEGELHRIPKKLENIKGIYGYLYKDESFNEICNTLIELDINNYYFTKGNGTLNLIYADLPEKNTIIYYENKTKDYSTWDGNKYALNADPSKSFLGTTITINDLLYSPNTEHRLFINDSCVKEAFGEYDEADKYKRIFYRVIKDFPNDGGTTLTEDLFPKPAVDIANIKLYIGPCFKNTFEFKDHEELIT